MNITVDTVFGMIKKLRDMQVNLDEYTIYLKKEAAEEILESIFFVNVSIIESLPESTSLITMKTTEESPSE